MIVQTEQVAFDDACAAADTAVCDTPHTCSEGRGSWQVFAQPY